MQRWLVLFTILITAQIGCGGAKSEKFLTSTLTGTVVDETNQPVAGAQLRLVDGRATATSNDTGVFNLTLPATDNTNVVLGVTKPGFVNQSLRTTVPASGISSAVSVTLRAKAPSVAVAMPAAGEPPASVATPMGDGSVALRIPHQALVTSSGAQVTGTVDVALTYFHPRSFPARMPFNLFADDGNSGVGRLLSFGMADVEISQGGEQLQVAPGATLGLDFNAPINTAGYVSAYQSASKYMPKLFSGDANTGLWVEEGDLGSPVLAYDANANQFSAKLSHLSSWNIDSYLAFGGCAQGHVQRIENGKFVAAANTPVRVWFADRDETAFFDTSTNGSGDYCITPGVARGAPDNIVRYVVSGRNDVHDTDMCVPFPAYCSTCVDTQHQFDCQGCSFRDDEICGDDSTPFGNYDIVHNVDFNGGCNPRIGCNSGSSEGDLMNCRCSASRHPCYTDSACPENAKFKATLRAGAGCGDPACFQLQTITIGGGTPPVTQTTTPPGSSTPPTATPVKPPTPPVPKGCEAGSKFAKSKGQACNTAQGDVCCPEGKLICSDHLCVPDHDS